VAEPAAAAAVGVGAGTLWAVAAASVGVGAGTPGAVAVVAVAAGVGAGTLGAAAGSLWLSAHLLMLLTAPPGPAAEAGLDSVAVEPGWEGHSSAGAVVDAAEPVGLGFVVAV